MTNATRLPADLAGALALIDSLTVQRDAAEAREKDADRCAQECADQRDQLLKRAEEAEAHAEKATGMVEGLVKENERFRHAAAETADLLMRGALEDDLSSAQQMVAELRAVLAKRHHHDVAGG
jgi:hypothetical protein